MLDKPVANTGENRDGSKGTGLGVGLGTYFKKPNLCVYTLTGFWKVYQLHTKKPVNYEGKAVESQTPGKWPAPRAQKKHLNIQWQCSQYWPACEWIWVTGCFRRSYKE